MMPNLSIASLILFSTLVISYFAFNNEKLKNALILHPWRDSREKRYFTFITSGLIHADWMHLGMNMLTYYFFAFYLESFLGQVNFLILYSSALVLSDLPTFFKYRNRENYRSLGASGAISAVVFSYIFITVPLHQGMSIYVFFFPIPAWLFGLLYLGYSFYMSKRSDSFINHDAHFYGALAGIALTPLLFPESLESWKYFNILEAIPIFMP